MFLVLLDFNHVIAPEEWAFDNSLRAPGLVLHNLLQIILDRTSVLAGMRDEGYHSIGDGISSVLEHLSSAGWTRGYVHSAVLTRDVSHWTGGYWDLSRNEETHRALELI